jgi:acetyl esterase/lipase
MPFSPRRRRPPSRPRSAVRPVLEPLEGRSLPSAGLSFRDPIDYAAGRSPRSVAVADFNGDGLPDLAVANSGSNSVSVFLGSSDGSLSPAGTVAVGTTPSYVTTGDFNGDRLSDLAVANTGSNTVSVLLGNGSGGFGPAGNFAVGAKPVSVAAGDWNGDGNLDLAVANSGANTVSVLRGQGNGSFESATPFATGGSIGASSVAIADFDRDGRPDLVAANRGPFPNYATPGTVAVLRQNEDGTFGPARAFAVGANPAAVVVADLNGDGTMDAATANLESDNVSVLLGNGDGSLAPARNYQVGRTEALAVGDFNGDGIPDIATANRHSFASVLPGNGDGTFQVPCDFWAGAEPVAVAVGDFNGDARADLAVAQAFSGQLSVLLNDGPQPGDGVTVVRNVVYTDGPPANAQRQSLDLYLPPNQTDFPVVFLAYGGQFRNGDKARLAYLARTLAREGLGVVSVNYRLTDRTDLQVVHPGHVEDVAQAFAWTYRHVAEYGGDPNQIVLMGHSAGASLVSMLATDRRYLAAEGLSPDLVRGVIGVSAGLYDERLLATDPNGPFGDVFGTPEQQWEASPLRYVDGTQPPFLVLFGQFDIPEIPADSTAFYQALVGAGSEAELHMIPDRTHAGIIGRSARPGDPARDLILTFIARHTSWDLAHVADVRVNDGSAQRSMVNSLTVTFDRAVSVESGAFEVRHDGGGPVDLLVSTSVVGGKTVAVLTFAGADVVGGSLADGAYSLTVRADRVHDRWGRELDGDGDGSAGGDRLDGFRRLFGDADGDGDTDQTDFGVFLTSFGKRRGEAGYLWFFDYDADGAVDGLDMAQFNKRRLR